MFRKNTMITELKQQIHDKHLHLYLFNIYFFITIFLIRYSNMAQKLSAQSSVFGVVFFILKSFSGIKRQKKTLKKFTILTWKPWSHVRILIYIEHEATTGIWCRHSIMVQVVRESSFNMGGMKILKLKAWNFSSPPR